MWEKPISISHKVDFDPPNIHFTRTAVKSPLYAKPIRGGGGDSRKSSFRVFLVKWIYPCLRMWAILYLSEGSGGP